MRRRPLVLAFVASGLVACTGILGDFSVGDDGSIDAGGGDGAPDVPITPPNDGSADSPGEGASADGPTPPKDGGNDADAGPVWIGNGTFRAVQDVVLSATDQSSTYGLAAGDVDGDGNPDLLGCTATDVALLMGKGDGTFQAPRLAGVQSCDNLAIIDFNKDPYLDVAVVERSSKSVQILKNTNGQLSVALGLSLSTTAIPLQIAVADFDRDTWQDFVVSTSGSAAGDNAIYMYRNQQNGSYSLVAKFSMAEEPYDVVAGDVNNDQLVDLVIGSQAVNVYFAKGMQQSPYLVNNFTPYPINGQTVYPYAVVLGDFTHSGKVDFAAAAYTLSGARIFRGDGTGNFSQVPSTVQLGKSPYGLTTGDYNGDGIPDLAASLQLTTLTAVALSNDGGFGSPATLGQTSPSTTIVTADFNRDRKLDLAVHYTSASPRAGIFLGN